MRSPAKRRIRSSSAERKKRDSPGSPCRPERPRSWLSMRRGSWGPGPPKEKAPRHVGGDRDRALAPRLGDGLALALGVLGLGVEDDVLDAPALQLPGDHLR